MDTPPMANTSGKFLTGVLTDPAIQRSYFFDGGLLFECQRCNACCTGAPGTIYVGPDEIAPIADHCGFSRAELISAYLYPFKDSYSIREDADGSCMFLKGGCAIYEVRPLQCRSFPFWFSNLRAKRQWDRLYRTCPGIGKGRRYTKEEIMELARQTVHL